MRHHDAMVMTLATSVAPSPMKKSAAAWVAVGKWFVKANKGIPSVVKKIAKYPPVKKYAPFAGGVVLKAVGGPSGLVAAGVWSVTALTISGIGDIDW